MSNTEHSKLLTIESEGEDQSPKKTLQLGTNQLPSIAILLLQRSSCTRTNYSAAYEFCLHLATATKALQIKMFKESEQTPESTGFQPKTQFYAYLCVRLYSSTFTDTLSRADFFGQSYNKFIITLCRFPIQRRWNLDNRRHHDWLNFLHQLEDEGGVGAERSSSSYSIGVRIRPTFFPGVVLPNYC